MERFNEGDERNEIDNSTNEGDNNSEPPEEAQEQDSQELEQPSESEGQEPQSEDVKEEDPDDKPLEETPDETEDPSKETTETEPPADEESNIPENDSPADEESADKEPLETPPEDEDSSNIEDENVPDDKENLDDKELPEESETPNNEETPENTEKPEDTEELENKEEPENTEEPENKEEPENTEEPENKEEPDNTDEPEDEHEPEDDELPKVDEVSEGDDPAEGDDTTEGAEKPEEEKTEPQDDGTDWDRTSLTPEQEEELHDMLENGELDVPEVDPDWEEPEAPTEHLPTEKTGTFEDERGNSAFHPNDEDALAKMKEYGRDSVDYKDNNPDFSPFTKHDTPYGEMDGQVEIPHMTDNRENPTWEYGRRPAGTSHDPNYDLGNFAQADNELSKKMGNMTPEEVAAYRKANNLTWHECPDGKTMQLVPSEIHDACRHSGGVSEQKYRMAMGDVTAPYD